MFQQYISRSVPAFQGQKQMGLYATDVGYIEANKNYACKTRVLGDYYIIIVTQGSGTFVSRDRHYDLKEGDAYFLFPNVLHSYKTDPHNLLSHYWVGFNGSNAKTLFDQIGVHETNAVVHCGKDSAVFQSAHAIFDTMETRSLSTSLQATGDLYTLFAHLAHTLDKGNQLLSNKKALSPIQAAIEFMENNYANPISISMAAEFAGLSRAYFSTTFSKETGMSPIEFLKTLRMDQALHYLKNTSLTIKEIAHSVGYDNGLYFSKDFSKRYGICPTQYRETLRK